MQVFLIDLAHAVYRYIDSHTRMSLRILRKDY